MKRVVLAMSGGVDSSAAAVLLKREGYEVIGLFMRSGATEEEVCSTDPKQALPIINSKSHKQGCCSASDAADARRVADSLDIPFHALNFEDAFGRIKDYFADEYLAGRTPNPCVMCNNWLKFGHLWDFAQQVGAQHIASGHYAQILPDSNEKLALMRGLDGSKDQSYVLFGIQRDLLPNVLFPCGGYNKTQIRELAEEAGLRVHNKPDSQEICFIPDNDYAGFIERYRGDMDTAGNMVDTSGNVLTQHSGYEKFTVGQRKGLGITFGSPRFVVKIDADSKQVVIGTKDELGRSSLEADRLNWLVDVPNQFECSAMIRYRHTAVPATVTVQPDNDRMQLEFVEHVHGVAPGQAVVCYDGNRVLGGGWIR